MAVGLSSTNLADAWLNTMRGGGAGTTFTAPAALYAEMHTADPAAAGATANSSGITTRTAMSFAAPTTVTTTRSMSLSAGVSFTATGPDTLTHVAVFSLATAGTFYMSAALTASKTVANGDTLTISTFTFSVGPLAA